MKKVFINQIMCVLNYISGFHHVFHLCLEKAMHLF